MKNIIILGSNGNLGKAITNYLILNNKLFLDSKFNIKRLLSIEFLNKNNISCVINCIGSHNNKNLFFKSNFILPYTISEKLSKIDSYLENKLLFIHISSIAVNAPYMKNNLNSLPLMTLNKSEIKYNQYEFSKACGEVVIRKNLSGLQNISTVILQPSNIIFDKSLFLKNLRIFLFLIPFKVNASHTLPLTPINFLLNYLNSLINSNFERKLIIKKLYKRITVGELFKNKNFFEKLKIEIPLGVVIKLIEILPENKMFNSIKRKLILIFIL